eukprot:8656305-Pyramimonas_sp.AAC.2
MRCPPPAGPASWWRSPLVATFRAQRRSTSRSVAFSSARQCPSSSHISASNHDDHLIFLNKLSPTCSMYAIAVRYRRSPLHNFSLPHPIDHESSILESEAGSYGATPDCTLSPRRSECDCNCEPSRLGTGSRSCTALTTTWARRLSRT